MLPSPCILVYIYIYTHIYTYVQFGEFRSIFPINKILPDLTYQISVKISLRWAYTV